MADQLLEVGRTGKAHGVRGTLYLDLLTDRVERVSVGARLKIGDQWLTVERANATGTRWLIDFRECADRTTAERLAGQPVFAEPLATLPDGMYVHQLIGAEVVGPTGQLLGRCVAVVANPAHDLLELDDGSLVPTVFITTMGDGQVVVDPPEGLFDLAE